MLCRKLSVVVIPTIAVALFTCNLARANLVTNGGFEVCTGTAPKDFLTNVLPTDWSGGGFDFIDAPGTADNYSYALPVYPGFPATSPQGGNFVQTDSTPTFAAPVTQMIFGLTAGQSYAVSFYQAAGQGSGDSGATTDQWEVTLGSSSTAYSSLMSIPQGGMFPWTSQTLTLTADNTSDLLSFIAVGSGGVPPQIFLDGVDMETSVPEPSALMLLAGVGAVISIGRIGRRMRANRTGVAT
jgi:hypothetical protein